MKMINSFIFRFLSFAILLSIVGISCKKQVSAEPEPTDPKQEAETPSGTTCTGTRADGESIAIFPADNPWNKDISSSPVDPNNAQIIASLSSYSVKADFGSGLWEGKPIGIPYVVVCGDQVKYGVSFRQNDYDGNYGDESDKGPYAIPLNAPIEGDGEGDAHVIAVDKDNRILYELYNASVNGNTWEASSGAIFDLKSNTLRPETWTSADAAGLPIFPGLVRYEEIVKGVIDHPIRFTLGKPNVKAAYISPARHKVNSTGGQYSLPFGARLRLKSNFDVSTYPPSVQIILNAMKKYGIILADIGSNFYISGAPDERWKNDDLQKLGKIKGADFEVVKLN